jgi:hypothetical protein
MFFATKDGLGLQLDKDNNRIVPCDADGAYNNNVELGDSGLEFTNLHLSGTTKVGSTATEYAEGHIRFKFSGGAYIDQNTVGQNLFFRTSSSSSLDTTAVTIHSGGVAEIPAGVRIGGTAAANTLDDYEEGTWTPTVASGTGGFTGTPEGVYVKVGNIVHVKAVFYVDVNFSNNAIGGLPFTVADDVTASVLGWNGTVVCETASINCSAAESDTVINFFNEGDSGSSHNPSTTGLLYRVSVTYKST